MTEESLKKGQVLSKTIETTKKGIENLEVLLLEVDKKPGRRDNELHDGLYNLCISEHKDGSGKKADLSRYGGNVRLLKVIIKELKTQLQEYEEQFEKL